MPTTLVDTGPIVAYLHRRERHHRWAVKQFSQLQAPLLTCDAVITEVTHLLHARRQDPMHVLRLIDAGVLTTAFGIEAEVQPLMEKMQGYASLPMDLADACLVRMMEVYPQSRLLTLDSDFLIYRKHRDQHLEVIMP